MPSSNEREQLIGGATAIVFLGISIFFVSGRQLCYCKRPGHMVKLPFTGLKGLIGREITEGGYLAVARAVDSCFLLSSKGNSLTCFEVKSSRREFVSAIPSKEGTICVISKSKDGVRSTQLLRCDGKSCTLLDSYIPLLPGKGTLTDSLPIPGGCLELYSGSSTPTLVCYSRNGNHQATVPLMGPVLALRVFDQSTGLLTIPRTDLVTDPYVDLLSWSPPNPPQIISIPVPAGATYFNQIPNSGAVLAMNLTNGELWIINNSGSSRYSLQLQPPLEELSKLNPDRVSLNDDGTIIIWSRGNRIQAASTTMAPLPWQERSTTLQTPHGSLCVVQHHYCGELRPVPFGTSTEVELERAIQEF